MIKHLLSSFFIFSVSVCLFVGNATAQSKKESKPAPKSADSKNLNTPSAMEGVQVAPSDVSGKSTKVKKTYAFFVIVNPADEPAMQLWTSLPNRLPEVNIVPSQSVPFGHIVVSSNPEIGLFKRAYGAYFSIFTEEDLDAFKQGFPCLGELGSELSIMTTKLSGQ